MKLAFGKHEGREISDIPHDYLLWLYRRNRPLQKAIEKELGITPEGSRPAARQENVDVPPGMLSDLVEAGVRALAQKAHPDHGGNTQKMQELNAVRDKLRK